MGGEVPAPSQVYFTAIGLPALNAVLVTLIRPNVFSGVARLLGSVALFAADGCDGVVVDLVVVVDDLGDLEAGGLALVEAVEGVCVVGVPVVLAVVPVEETLAEPPPEPSPQPAITPAAHRHAATPVSEAARETRPRNPS
jgi:hypothetical protein